MITPNAEACLIISPNEIAPARHPEPPTRHPELDSGSPSSQNRFRIKSGMTGNLNPST
jgi:hypothetical protein